jgi:glycosyltransferase involved in cell wall biosynthesis
MEINISVCIIVKNEEIYIEDCIKSVLDFAYEIIILDTGSTDKTKDIVLKYNKVKLYESIWENNFSIAKNKAISYANGNWILNLSADERVTKHSADKMLEYVYSLNKIKKPMIIYFNVLEYSNDGSFITSYLKDYLFNSGYDIHYIRPIHEYLVTNNNLEVIRQSASFLNIVHIGETRKKSNLINKKSNYINQIQNLISSNIDQNDNYYYYRHLGDEYFETNQPEKALEAYSISYDLINKIGLEKSSSFYQSVLSRIIKTLIFFHKNYIEALKYIEEQLKVGDPSYECLFHLGLCKNRLDNSGIQIHLELLDKIALTELTKPLISNIYIELGRFSLDINDKLNYLLKAHNIFPNSKPIIRYIIFNYLYNNDIDNASLFLRKINPTIKDININTLIQELKKEKSWEKKESEVIDSIFTNLSF